MRGGVVAQVETEGDTDDDGDKSAWRRMRITRAWRWSAADSAKLAMFAAEQVLSIYEAYKPDDDRPRRAIKAARTVIDAAADAADDAAADAARAAAYAADAAAYAEMRERIAAWMVAHIETECEEITAPESERE